MFIFDALSELPPTEITRPANVQESKLFISIFTQIREEFNIPIKDVLGDSIYDAEYILDFIINDLKAKPYLAINPRRSRKNDTKLSKSGGLICLAGFEMIYWGKFKDRGKTRLKFVCPITLCKQNPSVKELNATANHCTIAHITVLLVALTAVKSGNQDKIYFVKKFLLNL